MATIIPEVSDTMKTYGKWSGVERSLAPVSLQLRYVLNEKDMAHIEAGLIERDQMKITGVSRGLGPVPEDVYGFAIQRDTDFIETESGYLMPKKKTYCGPFHRSLIGEVTKTHLVDGVAHRYISPTKFANFCNIKVFEEQVFSPDDLEYVTITDGKMAINKSKMKRTMKFFVRLALTPFIHDDTKTWKDKNYFSICIMCGELGYGKCAQCDVKIRKLRTDTPLVSLGQLFEPIYEIMPHNYEEITKFCRRDIEYYIGKKTAMAAIPDGRRLFEVQSEVAS